MKKIHIITFSIIILLLGMGILQASCTKVDTNEAVEQITVSEQVQVYENITKNVRTVDEIKTRQMEKEFQEKLIEYQNAIKSGQQATMPARPIIYYKFDQVITSIPKTVTKNIYYFDWQSLTIKSKQIKEDIYETKNHTTKQIKSGYMLNQSDQSFYKCDFPTRELAIDILKADTVTANNAVISEIMIAGDYYYASKPLDKSKLNGKKSFNVLEQSLLASIKADGNLDDSKTFGATLINGTWRDSSEQELRLCQQSVIDLKTCEKDCLTSANNFNDFKTCELNCLG